MRPTRRHFILTICSIGILLGSGAFALAGDDASKRGRDRIEVLVELLASKNEVTKERPAKVRVPADYDEASQAIVFLAIQQLLQEGSTAFDVLLEHLDDDRYSISYDAPSGVFHRSVGSVCRAIMNVGIYPYEDLGVLRNITDAQHALHKMPKNRKGQKGIKQWWTQNRSQPLWKIQVEMIDEQIAYFEKLDLAAAPPSHPFAEKRSLKKLEELRAINIANLEGMKKAINAMEEPYRPKSIDESYGALTWLPWPTHTFNK